MTLAIYWGSGSPNSWRVLLGAELLRIPYDSKLLEFTKGHHKTPELLALNPRGKLPILRDGDFALYESIAILQYLDRLGSGALHGTTPRSVGLNQRIISEFECYVRDPLSKVIRHLFAAAGAPTPPQVPSLEEATALSETVRAELATLSGLVKSRSWLSGDRAGAADVAIYPYVRMLVRALSKSESRARELSLLPIAGAFPDLAGWLARVEELPGYERTYPPHWRGP